MARIGDLLERVGARSETDRRPSPPPRPVATSRPGVQPAARPSPGAVPVAGRMQLLDELREFVVPAYGFERRADADAFLSRVGPDVDDGTGRAKPRNVGYGANRVFVEAGTGFTSLGNDMDLDPFGDRSGVSHPRYRQPWGLLKPEGVDMPGGAFNALLLVEGRRTASYHGNRKRAVPYVSRARSGPWDMAMAWERGDGSRLTQVGGDETTRIYAAHSARGVIIARRAILSANGSVENYLTRVWLVKLDVMDNKGPDAEHLVRPDFRVSTYHDDAPTDPLSYLDGVHPDAQKLFRRAAEIFNAQCAPGVPEAVSKPLAMFKTQNAKRSGPESYTFRGTIKSIGYMAALDKAQEPWQLAVVVSEYGGGSEFAPNPMSYTRGQTTGEMLRRYKEARPTERGALIDRWWKDYVYPSEGGWDYTGD